MSIIVDLIIIAIIAICIFSGYTKGLVKVATRILGFFIAVVLAVILFMPVSNFIINNTSIQKNIEKGISESVKSSVIKPDDENAQVIIEEDKNSKVINQYIDKFIKNEKQTIKTEEGKIIDNVSASVSIRIVRIGTAIAIFIIAKFLLVFINVFADILEKLPIIGKFNKVGGLLYGILQSLLIIYIGLGIVSLIAPTLENPTILETINNSTVCKFFYDNNIVLQLLF